MAEQNDKSQDDRKPSDRLADEYAGAQEHTPQQPSGTGGVNGIANPHNRGGMLPGGGPATGGLGNLGAGNAETGGAATGSVKRGGQ